MKGRRLIWPLASLLVLIACDTKPDPPSEPAKIFNYHRSVEYKSLDPPRQFDLASGGLVQQVYDSLFEYHYLKRPYEMIPNLLAKMPTLSEDGLVYSFELKQGIKFADDECFEDKKGRELTADDVLFTLKRYADANVNTRSYDTLLGGRVVGLDAYREKTRLDKDLDHTREQVEGLKKTGTHTFTIKLTRQDPLALYPFAAAALSIYPPEAVAHHKQKFERHPVGTGPFVLTKNPRRGTMVFTKNPNYHLKYPEAGDPGDEKAGLLANAGKQIPLVDELHMPLIEEHQPAMLKFQAGELDWIGLDKDNFSKMAYKDDKGIFRLKEEYAELFDLYQAETLIVDYWSINMKDPRLGDCRGGAKDCDPDKNKALRQALSLVLDMPGFIEKMRNGRGQVLKTIVPLPISGSERDIKAEGVDTDLKAAAALLEEAGFPGGEGLPEIVIDFRTTRSSMRQDFEYHRAQAAKIGIKLKANFQSFTAFLRKIESGNFQIAAAGWQAVYPDPENLYQLLYSPNKAPGPNACSFHNADYDKHYVEMKAMAPGPDRHDIIEKMAVILREESPIIAMWTPISVGLTQKWTRGMKRNFLLNVHVKYLDIDLKAKGLVR